MNGGNLSDKEILRFTKPRLGIYPWMELASLAQEVQWSRTRIAELEAEAAQQFHELEAELAAAEADNAGLREQYHNSLASRADALAENARLREALRICTEANLLAINENARLRDKFTIAPADHTKWDTDEH